MKTITAPAIQFKGSGWYITDYAKKTSDEKKQKPQDKAKKETKKTEAPSPPKDEKQPSAAAKQS